MTDIIGNGDRQVQPAAKALHRKVQVVGQCQRQVGVKGRIQYDLRIFCNVGTRQKNLLRKSTDHLKITRVDIVKRAVYPRHIRQFVWNRRKPDALTNHDQFLPAGVLSNSGTVIDFPNNSHSTHPLRFG